MCEVEKTRYVLSGEWSKLVSPALPQVSSGLGPDCHTTKFCTVIRLCTELPTVVVMLVMMLIVAVSALTLIISLSLKGIDGSTVI